MPMSSQKDPTQWSATRRHCQQAASADIVTAPWAAATATDDVFRYRRHYISYSTMSMNQHLYPSFLDHPFGNHDHQDHYQPDFDLTHTDFLEYQDNGYRDCLMSYSAENTAPTMASWNSNISTNRQAVSFPHERDGEVCTTPTPSSDPENLVVMPLILHYSTLQSSLSPSDPSPLCSSIADTSVYGYFPNLSISAPITAYTSSHSQSGTGIFPVTDEENSLQSGSQQDSLSQIDVALTIRLYLEANDPVAAGELAVVIMTSKVAQKSYGTEKRFLCPPPTTILVGKHWWSQLLRDTGQGESSARLALLGNEASIMSPPKVMATISSSEASAFMPGQIEWFSQSGSIIGQTGCSTNSHQRSQPLSFQAAQFRFTPGEGTQVDGEWFHNPRNEAVAGGRCVSKQMYIQDVNEKRKRVQCLVKIHLMDQSLLGLMPSKYIKVISKPTKKRQSAKNTELCIYHGSTVSLFNRIRAQTVSTRYLAVSSNRAGFMYPGRDICHMNQKPDDKTCFIARSNAWDPFIIWTVDTISAQSNGPHGNAQDYIGHGAFVPKMSLPYPPPPTLALKNTSQQPLAIHYNQHVVLQCLTTGLVSPVMIIRRVDHGTTVVGGQKVDVSSCGYPVSQTRMDEALGDPVSQLHKIGLQVVQDIYSTSRDSLAISATALKLSQRSRLPTYLACHNDTVNIHEITDIRKTRQANAFGNGASPDRKRRATSVHCPAYCAVKDLKIPLANEKPQDVCETSTPVATRKRVSSANDFQSPHTATHPQYIRIRSYSTQESAMRRFSLESKSIANDYGSSSGNHSVSDTMDNGPSLKPSRAPGAYWSEDISEAAVWTIVGTDIAKHTFWTAPSLKNNPTRRPSFLFPILSHYTIPVARKEPGYNQDDRRQQIVHLHGEHLSKELQVWFGDIRADHCICRSCELLLCHLPSRQSLLSCPYKKKEHGAMTLPILLVRGESDIVHRTGVSLRF